MTELLAVALGVIVIGLVAEVIGIVFGGWTQ